MKYSIITGEYPPQKGGVADYTQMVSEGLARNGDEVHVWAPLSDIIRPSCSANPVVRRVKTHFNRADLAVISEALREQQPDRLLVQYVPHAFGFKAMNIVFCLWLRQLRSLYPIWIMFHEIAFPVRINQSVRRNVLGITNRVMARIAAGSAERIFVSTASWRASLKAIAPGAVSSEWLPVPSNVSRCDGVCGQGLARNQYTTTNEAIIGHFGTYGSSISAILRNVLPIVLEGSANTRLLCLGSGSREFIEDFRRKHPSLAPRVHASGFLRQHELSHHIATCDLMFQPYPDGASGRRTSTMAALAIGTPVVTTKGILTERVWTESRAVALGSTMDRQALAALIISVLGDRRERERLSRAGSALYRECFDLKHTIARLQDAGGVRSEKRRSEPVCGNA
jgi:glycosyltransferase involved in cell wall biosynthesis